MYKFRWISFDRCQERAVEFITYSTAMASSDWQLTVDGDYGQAHGKYVRKELFVWHSMLEEPRFSLKSLVLWQLCLQDAEVLAKTFENQASNLQPSAHLMLCLKNHSFQRSVACPAMRNWRFVWVRHVTCDIWVVIVGTADPAGSCQMLDCQGLWSFWGACFFLGGVLQIRPSYPFLFFLTAKDLCFISFLPHVLIDGTWCIALVFRDRQERKMTGIKAAEEALQFYGMVNQKSGEVEAEPFVMEI